MGNLAQLKRLNKLTLWRVGARAEGPGREPEEPLLKVALANDQGWAFSVDGDGRVDSTNLSAPPDANPDDVKEALVQIVEEATRREIRAKWSTRNADTWVATVAFLD